VGGDAGAGALSGGGGEGAGAGPASLVATLTGPLTAELAAGLAGVEWLEVRADLVGDVDPEALRQLFPGKLLYTLRSRAEGGGFEGSPDRRKRRLLEAAARYDRIDLEVARDLAPELLDAVPPAWRLISWHGPPADLEALEGWFARMAAVDAALYKLVPAAAQSGEELPPLALLHKLARRDVVAFASGPTGVWTRLVAPRLGAPVVYGAAGELPGAAGAPGQPSIRTLREDYGLPALPPVAALFGVVGNPVAHSLSPRLHNGAYRELGIPALYLPFHAESFGDFWLEVVEEGILETLGLPLRGLSITAPYKAAALAVAGAESPLAGLIGAANTLVLSHGVWEAESTDPDGIVEPLRQRRIEVAGRRAAVLGAGGGGRSAAVGLAGAGAHVTLFNRTPERAEKAAADLGLPHRPLSALHPADYDILVNATPLGRAPDPPADSRGDNRGDAEPLPFAVAALRPGAVVIDLVYRQDGTATPLLAAAAAQGALAIDGREVLLGQARGQFRLMTGKELPVQLARRLLGLVAGH